MVPDALAALSLVRALTAELLKNGIIRPKDVEYIKATALKDLEQPGNENVMRARELVENEYP
jgi:hypothetical protein